MSRRRRPRGRPAVPAELTPVADWGPPPAETEGEPDPVVTQPVEPEPGKALVPAADDTALTREQAEALAKVAPCQHCGAFHVRACPRVKRMSFHRDGALAEVEFWRDGRWDETRVIWPDQLAEAE